MKSMTRNIDVNNLEGSGTSNSLSKHITLNICDKLANVFVIYYETIKYSHFQFLL